MESRHDDNTDESHVKTDEEGKPEPKQNITKQNNKNEGRTGSRHELVRNGSELRALKVDHLLNDEVEEEEEESCKCCKCCKCGYNSESPSCCSNQVKAKLLLQSGILKLVN